MNFKRKHLMNWTSVQLVIMAKVEDANGATWAQIKTAILTEGWQPKDWLTQVRGPLQGLIDDHRIARTPDPTQEHYYAVTSACA